MSEQVSGTASIADEGRWANLIYVLYLLGLVIGITSIVGVIMAYIFRDGAPAWVRTHYRYQIRTFWLGLLYVVIGACLAVIYVGYIILLFWFFWLVIRCVKGLKLVAEGRAIMNPATWLW